MERNEYQKQANSIKTIALNDSIKELIEKNIEKNLLEVCIFQINIDKRIEKTDLPYPVSHYNKYAEFRPINIYIFITQESIYQAIGVFGATQGRTNDMVMKEREIIYPGKIKKQELNISQIAQKQ